MGWATDYWDSFTYGTTMSSIAAGVNIYYDKKFLRRVDNVLRLAPLGQRRPLPKGEGKTIEFFRYHNISTSVSNRKLTEGVNPNATQVTGMKIQRQIREWGGFSQHSSLVKDTHIDRNLAGVSEIWGDDAANTIDLLTHMEVCANSAYPLRGDLSTTYSFSGVVDSASTTTIVDADLETNASYGDTDDDLNQSVVIITSGTGYGQARAVTDYVASGGTITVTPAWDTTPAANDTFWVTSADSTLTTSNSLLSTAAIRRAMRILKNNRAIPVGGGYYVGILSPETEEDLMADTNWVNVMQYKDSPEIQTQGLFRGEVGKWGGVRWVYTTQPFRFPQTSIATAGSAYGVGAFDGSSNLTNYGTASTDDVYATLILGAEAFGVTSFNDEDGIIRPGIIVKNPGKGDTSNPLNRFSTVGWYMPFVPCALNGMFAVQIWSVVV